LRKVPHIKIEHIIIELEHPAFMHMKQWGIAETTDNLKYVNVVKWFALLD
jgi:hypothetical protein